jgi:alkylated DNA repair dioxygenase AlkB
MTTQFHFFDHDALNSLEGLRYREAFIDPAEEDALIARIRKLPFKEFDFHRYKGKRRIVSFGWQYDFSGQQLLKADDIPPFLLPLRARAAEFANLEPARLQHVLVTEYAPGAGIGWHRDKAVFGQVVGVSLLSPCVLRFRRKLGQNLSRQSAKHAGVKVRREWERVNMLAEPRSAYHLRGPARLEWEHSILRVDALRYSITFRNMRED